MEDKYVTYLRSPVGQLKLTGDKTSVNSILFAKAKCSILGY